MRYLVDFVEVKFRTRRIDARAAKEARWQTLQRVPATERSAILIVNVRTAKRRRPKGPKP